MDYGYHANNLLKDVVSSNSGGVNVGYRYDALNRLAYVDDASTGTTLTHAYTYNPNGSLETLRQANGVVHTYGYDALNRLRTLNVTHGATSLHAYEYKLRASGHRRQVLEGTRTTTYTYDELYRLTREAIAGDTHGNNGEIGYDLDKVGNRKARSSQLSAVSAQPNLTYNARDWLNSDTYDANGNTVIGGLSSLVSGLSSLSGTDVYDFENRLIVRTRADGSTINLSYNADGIRTKKSLLDSTRASVSVTSWLIDTNNLTGYAQVLEERISSVQPTAYSLARTYTYGTQLLSCSETRNTAPETRNFHCFAMDGHGNVRELTDTTGTVTDRYDYDAFGNLIHRSGSTTNAYLYAGEQYDEDLGLYYNRARYLNTDSGRFWSMDGFEGGPSDPISLHKYLYANADPVMFSDPSGNFSLAELKATVTNIGLMARLAIPRIMTAATTITTAGIAMLRMGFERLMNVVQFASQRMATALSQGRVLLRSASGGWRLRVLKLRSGGTGRPSYEILNWKNVARFEAHPINRNWPSWAFYPHGHIDFLGTKISHVHLPVIELSAAVTYFAYRLMSDDEKDIDDTVEPMPE